MVRVKRDYTTKNRIVKYGFVSLRAGDGLC